jgi:hypothetical protein
MASVVDEADALAWSGQVELAPLARLFERMPSGAPVPAGTGAGREELLAHPAAHRGAPTRIAGRLVSAERVTFAGEGEGRELGPLWRGLLVDERGALQAFLARAERPPLVEAVGADQRIAVNMPPPGTPVLVAGLFLKRWVALDARGTAYVAMPLIAAGEVTELGGEAGDRLRTVTADPGLLPLRLIEAPGVWSRPVVELGEDGGLRLDGAPLTWAGLEERLWPLAARDRNPLGDSALAVVVIAAPRAPASDLARLRELPGRFGARCIVRPAGPEPKGN